MINLIDNFNLPHNFNLPLLETLFALENNYFGGRMIWMSVATSVLVVRLVPDKFLARHQSKKSRSFGAENFESKCNKEKKGNFCPF